jgi:6-phosphofructokinase 2
MAQSVITLTMNPAIDVSSTVDRIVAERKLRCGDARREPGGGGINVSRALGALGGQSVAFYLAGGPTGQIFKDLLDAGGVESHLVPIAGWTREDFTVVDESSGSQFRFVLPGPEVAKSEWERCLQELEAFNPKPTYLVASGSLPPGVPSNFYGRVARLAKQSGSRLVLDTSGEALGEAADVGAYLLKPNLRELRELAGQELDDEEQQAEAAQRLVREGACEVVVVSLGAAGVLVASRDGCERLRSPTVSIRSKVGAGDSMVAGIVLGLIRGQPLREVILLGLAAGAAAVMQRGTGLCKRGDTERLFNGLLEEAA